MMKSECNSCGTINSLDFIINLEAKLTASYSIFFFVFLSFLTQREKEIGDD